MKQSERIINKLKEAFLPQNLECDGGACIGCWKDVVREAIKMLEDERQTAIEFAKWKDNNYSLWSDNRYYPIIMKSKNNYDGKTLDQLYEEWENGNG